MPDRRILIVDDAEEPRAVLAIALRTISGAAIQVAENAEKALALLGTDFFDVLITDVHLGGMTGLELMSALRERGQWPASGVVVISGESDPDLPQQALESRAAAFFGKPFSASEVRNSVLLLLESNHSRP